MNTECARLQAQASELLFGELDEATRGEIERHAAECEACAAALAGQARLHELIAAGLQAGPPPVYFESVLAEIHRRMPAPARRRTVRGRRWTRPRLGSTLIGGLFLLWCVAVAGPDLERFRWPAPDGGTVARAETRLRLASRQVIAKPTTVIARAGFFARDSEVLRQPEQYRELGLLTAEAVDQIRKFRVKG